MEEPEVKKKSIFQKVKNGLNVAVQVLLAVPVKLPSVLLDGARYVAMLLGLLDALEEEEEEKEDGND
ncbi:hypothetical protein SAMN05216436_102144 [bacterium A37T11]|nr:hypothetical protein SAMN05216436_102144 [bacterium A37T11]